MNVSEAKIEIKRTIKMYLDKDEEGEYIVPGRERRPIFIEGVPGIGKRAVIEQTAAELEVALAVCSVAHHTRQSALGHVYSVKKEYEGRSWQASEYAMGEIMGAVYDVMRESGEKEGILFLDEFSCASDALMPAILQLLQDRLLGGKRLPEGWVMAVSGSLPEHDRTVRKFGPAVRDRMNCLRVEADFGAWKAYAYRQEVHGAVISFLEINRDCFYDTDETADGREYATPRGWLALSSAVRSYEKKAFPVNQGLALQYIASRAAAERFLTHYEVFLRQRGKYSAEDVLRGARGVREDAVKMGRKERIMLLAVLLESLNHFFVQLREQEAVLRKMEGFLREAGEAAEGEGVPLCIALYALQERQRECRRRRQAANNLDKAQNGIYRRIDGLLESWAEAVRREETPERQRQCVEKEAALLAESCDESRERGREMLGNAAAFVEEAWGEGEEKAFFAAELAASAAGDAD